MSLISCGNVSLSFGAKTILESVSFQVEEKNKIGLVGVNGSGKTSLFKLIIGEYTPDDGTISKSGDTKIGYMEQFSLSLNVSMYDEVIKIFSHLDDMETELEEIHSLLEQNGGTNALIERQHLLTEQFERLGGLTYKSRVKSALLGLGFSETQLYNSISELSGGQRSKVQLCKMLLSDSSLLLLDEPTNHLDIKSVEWLEDFLLSCKSAYIIISHDRYFLDRVTKRTFEIENCRLTAYNGNYSRFLLLKEELRQAAIRQNINTEREIKRIEGIIAQQKTFSQERNYITIASKQKQIDRIAGNLTKVSKAPASLGFKFDTKTGGGNDVLICKKLCGGYSSDSLIFRDIDIYIGKSERIFLLGPNGCGKTTLFKALCGKLPPKSGFFSLGSNISVGYYEQNQESLHISKTVLDEVWDDYPRMTETEVRSALGAFLFRGDDVFKTIGTLSGGERARISILKLMLSRANFLLLDEPTNHLDITSREALEQALTEYEGTVFMISHDRYFVNKLADRLYYMEGGEVTEYIGNYDYFEQRHKETQIVKAAQKPESVQASDYRQKKQQASDERKRQTQIAKTEATLDGLSKQIEEINTNLLNPDIAADYIKTLELSAQLEALREEEEQLFAKLEALYEG
ncbi:MAG: ABC-F family ATP-binding cassette domain-containing protein [Oscillospiraceae bacterium]|nr:ABC-F family ATP-binding cassette domain-containing protein [Oscillospiraceae bacterium]